MNTIIEKIRAEVERRKKRNKEEYAPDGLFEVQDNLAKLLSFLSDLEKSEKPTNIDFEQELYNHFGQVKDFTLGMQIGKYFYELGKQEKPINPQPVKELLTFDGFVDKVGSWFANLKLRRFRKTVDGEIYPATELVQAYEWFVHELSEKYREKHPQEQPVCEGLEEEIVKVCDDFAFPLYGLADDYGRELINKIARHFARWQKEQMTKDAVEGVVSARFGTISIPHNIYEKYDGQKVKLIIVKED